MPGMSYLFGGSGGRGGICVRIRQVAWLSNVVWRPAVYVGTTSLC